jgi:hypothetical protein
MRTRMNIFTLVTALAGLLAFSAVALAAPPEGKGKGGGGGGGDEVVIPDYGDLIMLYRDDYGVPIPSDVTQVIDPETGELVDGGECWQPIAFNVDDELLCPTECVVNTTTPATVAVDQYTCGVAVGCSGCTQEVDFGRMNVVRASEDVFDSQLADVIVNLATADCVSLDPAGRLVTSRVETVVDEFGEYLYDVVTSGAIDSPLQNLAIYRQLMLTGTIGVPLPADVLDTAARGLGAGSGKTGEVNVDLVAYLNQIMGLTDPATQTFLDKRCETYREEVMGVIQEVEKCFLNYGAAGSKYGYLRNANFEDLPAPAYIPETQYGQPNEGWFEVLAPIAPDVTDPFYQEFAIFRGPIFERVFGNTDAGSGGDYGIDDFAQAADDARATINYMHSWPLPVDYATPVPCGASGEIAYDVSISAESGLQVPRVIIDGSEGREFIVTVANGSGSADPASGTVTVTATPEAGGPIVGSPWTFAFTDLAVGASESWTTFFTVNLGQRTTINWTAVAAAPRDVISSNNTQTATSSVKVTGSGGGGKP